MRRERAERAAETIVVIVVLAALGKILGFFRDMVMAAYFGAGAVTDAYLAAAAISLFIFNILGGHSLGTTFIPVYCDVAAAGEKNRLKKFTGTVLGLAFSLFSVAGLLGYTLAPLLVGAVVPGLSPHTKELAVNATRLLVAGIPLMALISLLTSLLNVHNNFSIPAALGIPYNLAIAGFIFFSGAGTMTGLIAGTLTGYLMQALISLFVLNRMKVGILTALDCREPGLVRLGGLLLPVIAGGAVTQFNPLINRVLASGLPEGTISVLSYADKIVQVPLGLLVSAVITFSYPAMSRAFAGKRRGDMQELVNVWSGVLLFITAPVALALALLSHPLVHVLFERGAFGSDAAKATAGALFFYSAGLPFVAWGRFFARVFYTCHDSRTPMFIGMAVTVFNVFSCLVLIEPMGGSGLALASTISSVAGVLLTLACLKVKTRIFLERRMWLKVIYICAATAVAAVAMLAAASVMGGSVRNGQWAGMLHIIVVGGAGMAAYLISTRVLRLNEAVIMTDLIRTKLFHRWGKRGRHT